MSKILKENKWIKVTHPEYIPKDVMMMARTINGLFVFGERKEDYILHKVSDTFGRAKNLTINIYHIEVYQLLN